MPEWRQRLDSAWNEWGMTPNPNPNPNPLPEAEFKHWLQGQLSGATESRWSPTGLAQAGIGCSMRA